MTALKLIPIGNSVGVILPREMLARLKVDKGDLLHVTDSPGGITLTSHDPVFAARIDIARKVMKKRRNVLRELAK